MGGEGIPRMEGGDAVGPECYTGADRRGAAGEVDGGVAVPQGVGYVVRVGLLKGILVVSESVDLGCVGAVPRLCQSHGV